MDGYQDYSCPNSHLTRARSRILIILGSLPTLFLYLYSFNLHIVGPFHLSCFGIHLGFTYSPACFPLPNLPNVPTCQVAKRQSAGSDL